MLGAAPAVAGEFDESAYTKNPPSLRLESRRTPEYYRGEYRRFIAQKQSVETVIEVVRKKLIAKYAP